MRIIRPIIYVCVVCGMYKKRGGDNKWNGAKTKTKGSRVKKSKKKAKTAGKPHDDAENRKYENRKIKE